jgi:hypothetical protein
MSEGENDGGIIASAKGRLVRVGHIIFEALSAGPLPVKIGDATIAP